MRNTVHAYVDLSALQANLVAIRRLTKSRIMAMVKANAYGHGLIPPARALKDADGLGVARLDEAVQLRDAGIVQRILVLATLLSREDLALCSQKSIDVTVHDQRSFDIVSAQARSSPLRVWLKLDSGMHRLGLDPETFVAFDRALAAHPGILERVHMTHFSDSDNNNQDATDRQIRCFQACHGGSTGALASLANSAAIVRRPDVHADWVRPGILLYGAEFIDSAASVRAIMSLRALILAVRKIQTEESVGYGGQWTSRRCSRIATVGIGYGDGYPRHASNGTPICVHGQRVPLVGRVSMDSLTIDLTDARGIDVGDEATLWGPELPVAEIAACAHTISYSLLAGLTSRVQRIYTGGPAIESDNDPAARTKYEPIDQSG
jgi:alanine racemase